MRKSPFRPHRITRTAFWLVGALALVAGTSVWFTTRPGRADGRAPDRIAIVDGRGDVTRSPAADAALSPAAAAASQHDVAVGNLTRSYPMFRDVALDCRSDPCVLTGTVRPVSSQTELDKRQEMLVGGLAASLAADGYRMDLPFRFQEVADNEFRITASVTRAAQNVARAPNNIVRP